MKKYLLFLLTVFFISCSKDEPAPVPPVEEPTLVTKLIVVDTTKTAPNDTLAMTTYEYDALKRITKQTLYLYNPASQTYAYRYNFDYGYNGTETLASTMFENYPTPSVNIRWKHFFSHNAAGQLVADSSHDVTVGASTDSMVYTKIYTYTASEYQETRNDYYPVAGTTTYAAIKFQRDAGNNIVSLGDASVRSFFAYDNKINPLTKSFPVNAPYLNSVDFPCVYTNLMEQYSNFYKIFTNTYDGSGTVLSSVLTREFITIYGANNLPQTTRIRNYPATTTDKNKYIFLYQ
ncbi:MAG: hypothetical protein H7Y86_18920 [Rhizobacter sp.]|nr:hypothetical protein [Ferruginibacter sp.]